ncbi:hypothetical protein [Embleya sp. NPDC005575]|uniref:hypothetical protein n=1 Tax=Embleya sp. NPDC005575 TaxID=3156892 RepID=UPI0033BC1AED
MGVGTTYVTKAQLRELLGVNTFGLRRVLRREDFPASTKDRPTLRSRFDEDDDPVWNATEVYRWAAHDHDFAHRGAVLLRTDPEDPAPGRWAGAHATAQGPATDWHTDIGTIRLVHTDDSGAASAAATALVNDPAGPGDIVVVCALFGDIGFTGPALVAADTARPDIEYEAQWGRVVQLAGQPLPWWPHRLRLPELVLAWRPATPVVVTDVPVGDRETALRRAARNPVFGPAARAALTATADAVHNAHVEGTAMDADIFGRDRPGRGHPIVIAARPDPHVHCVPEIEDRDLLSAGWTQVAACPHPDAVAVLHEALYVVPPLLPFGPITTAPAGAPVARRWARRLAVCDPTAAHAALTDKPVDTFFVDPLTGMPALRTAPDDHDRDATWIFYAPLALPAGADLAKVTLHGTVWITTTDEQVHPAPCTPGRGDHLWWGDGYGDRATEASYVLHQLLDHPTRSVTLREHWQHAPEPLTDLLNREHPDGTELTRATLLRTRMTPPRGH